MRRDESGLSGIRLLAPSGANVGRLEQGDAQTNIRGRAQYLKRHQIPIFEGNAVSAVMEVVKFAGRGDSR